MEVSALKPAGLAGVHGRSPLLRLAPDERLVALIRRGHHGAFEALVGRYQARLLAFCRHMLGSREDAEDVLQEVFAAAFNAMQADDRPLNVRPWLYRIARNRSLNHLRRQQAIGVDSMDVHLSEGGLTTAERAHRREDFRLLVSDVKELPETQRTALLLREMDALSYEQIAEAMDTTVPSVKSLLVRARVGLAEAAEARQISCDAVRLELGEVAEGLTRLRPTVRRHVKACDRCGMFRRQLRETNKALAAVFPVGPLVVLKKLVLTHVGTAASGSAGSAAGTAAGTAAAGGAISAGLSAVATKAAAGIAAAAIVTAGAVEVQHVSVDKPRPAAAAPALASTGAVAAPLPRLAPPAPAPAKPAPKPRIAVPAKPVKPATRVAPPTKLAPVATGAAPTTPAPPRTQTVNHTVTLPPAPTATVEGVAGANPTPTSIEPAAPPESGSPTAPPGPNGAPAPVPRSEERPPPAS